MNLLINLKSTAKTQSNPFHGGNEYVNRIVSKLLETTENKNDIKLYFLVNSKAENIPDYLQKYLKTVYVFIIEGEIIEIIKKFNIDRIYDPLAYTLGENDFSTVDVDVFMTIHGVRPLEMPTDIGEFYLGSKKKYILKTIFANYYYKSKKAQFEKSINIKSRNKKIFVVSNHTKNSLISHLSVNENEMKVFYSPDKLYPDITEKDETSFFDTYSNINRQCYFLLVSTKRWIKNTYRALIAIDELANQGLLKHKIVLTGVSDKIRKWVNNKDYYLALDYVETKDLEVLYKNAYALLYPSLNEGFGYPPVEAMKYGTPVIASAICSIPEVCGDAALYFNPNHVYEIKTRILQMQDSKSKEYYSKKSLERYPIINKKQKDDLEAIVQEIIE